MRIKEIRHYGVRDNMKNPVWTKDGMRGRVEIVIERDQPSEIAFENTVEKDGGVMAGPGTLYCRVYNDGTVQYGFRAKDQWWSSRPGQINKHFFVDVIDVVDERRCVCGLLVSKLHELLETSEHYTPGSLLFHRDEEGALQLASALETANV